MTICAVIQSLQLFVEVFNAPPECEWAGRDGRVSAILRYLKMKPGSRDAILRVLRDVIEGHKAGVRYDPARKFDSGGHNKLIKMGSVEGQLVAGISWRAALVLLYRAVYSAYVRSDFELFETGSEGRN